MGKDNTHSGLMIHMYLQYKYQPNTALSTKFLLRPGGRKVVIVQWSTLLVSSDQTHLLQLDSFTPPVQELYRTQIQHVIGSTGVVNFSTFPPKDRYIHRQSGSPGQFVPRQ